MKSRSTTPHRTFWIVTMQLFSREPAISADLRDSLLGRVIDFEEGERKNIWTTNSCLQWSKCISKHWFAFFESEPRINMRLKCVIKIKHCLLMVHADLKLPHLPWCDWFDHDFVVYSKPLKHHNPDQSPSEAKTFTTIFVPSSCLKNSTRSSDFATWYAFKETTSWDFLSIHMASMLSKLLLSGSQMTSEHILRDAKKPSKQRISRSKVNINNNTVFGP